MDGLKLFGGVEGGATHSNLVICDETGKVVSRSKGLGTNHWILGIEECAKRIIQMVHTAKDEADIPRDRPLDSLGLTLSGCEQDSSNADLARRVKELDENSAKAIYVATDTAGSLFTGAPNGGMVLIAGTGSNALLRTPDGQQFGCGGWGYLLGDEGSAYWIAHRAIKIVLDETDGFRPAPHSITKVWETIRTYFKAETRPDLFPHAYKHFEKPFFAGLTAELSILADEGDALSQHIFADAGAALALHVVALASRSQNGTRPFENGLRIVCVGSVWKSWHALAPGALSVLAARRLNIELELVRLRVSSAMGAAWLAAKHVNFSLPRDDSAFCEVFYTYRPDNGRVKDIDGYGCGCSEFWS
ncbi:unnamed protein product [Leptosia nina]|uniref:N-acetyl-D-glucosamine kinase n=1 Tax=Leptosia nina TaxID=320188 RepID=A0AAV1IXP3_9NEOP